jgi:hypothetical protein
MAPDGELAGPGLNSFCYQAFNLSGCPAEEYLKRPEPLAWALAALMASGSWSRAEHKLACMRRIDAGRLDEVKRLLLMDCVETYLALTPEETEEYKRRSEREPERPMNSMHMTWSERMLAQGRVEGMRQLLLRQMGQRFGPVPERLRKKVESASLPRLTRLADKLLVAGSLEELGRVR